MSTADTARRPPRPPGRSAAPKRDKRSVREGVRCGVTIARLLVLSMAAACSGRSATAPPAGRDAGAGDAAPGIDAAAVDARPAGPALAPIAVDEVKAVVPVPAESRVVTPHREDAGRERVEVTFCFDEGSVADLRARVAGKLRAAGWELDVATPAADRADLAGRRGDLRLAGMLRRGPWVECQGARGQTYVVLGIHRPAP